MEEVDRIINIEIPLMFPDGVTFAQHTYKIEFKPNKTITFV